MKNENYEFIDEEHLPNIEKMRAAALAAKDPGPWIIDPLYGFLIDKNCESIELWSEEGRGNKNLEFIEVCNPRSVAYLITQRDDLLAALKYSLQHLAVVIADVASFEGVTLSKRSIIEKSTNESPVGIIRAAIAKCEAK